MRAAIAPLSRYFVMGRVGKRPLFVWANHSWCPSDRTTVFARDDDWSFGIVSSLIHEVWAREQSTTLEDRLSYSPKTALWTFPFPSPDDAQRDKIEQAARDIVDERSMACAKLVAMGKKQVGLTAVYNTVDLGGFVNLRSAHARLDEAVCKSYGWPTSVLGERGEIVARLYALNAAIAADPSGYAPFFQGERA